MSTHLLLILKGQSMTFLLYVGNISCCTQKEMNPPETQASPRLSPSAPGLLSSIWAFWGVVQKGGFMRCISPGALSCAGIRTLSAFQVCTRHT